MQPALGLSCKAVEILRARMRADLKIYRDAVVELEQTSGPDYKKAHQRAEHARLAYEDARRKFDEHSANHGCSE